MRLGRETLYQRDIGLILDVLFHPTKKIKLYVDCEDLRFSTLEEVYETNPNLGGSDSKIFDLKQVCSGIFGNLFHIDFSGVEWDSICYERETEHSHPIFRMFSKPLIMKGRYRHCPLPSGERERVYFEKAVYLRVEAWLHEIFGATGRIETSHREPRVYLHFDEDRTFYRTRQPFPERENGVWLVENREDIAEYTRGDFLPQEGEEKFLQNWDKYYTEEEWRVLTEFCC